MSNSSSSPPQYCIDKVLPVPPSKILQPSLTGSTHTPVCPIGLYFQTCLASLESVSYTHLDVYKRQGVWSSGPGRDGWRIFEGGTGSTLLLPFCEVDKFVYPFQTINTYVALKLLSQ